MVNPNAIGSATTGTRLLAHFKKIHPSVGALVVPQEVMSSTGELVAHLVLPVVPFGADFSGGAVSQAPGMTLLQVPPSQTVNLLYEVTAAAPFMGVNGCAKIQSFDIASQTLHPINWKNVDVSGSMVPLDPMPGSGATTAAPRFMP